MASSTFHPGHHLASPGRMALAGAVLFIVLSLLFWATAAAQALPPETPAWVQQFTPDAGLERLTLGLAWSAIAGAILGVLVSAAAIGLRRRARGH